MNIALVIEYFPPFAFGGSEWSTYYLALELVKNKDLNIYVFTPNYGYKKLEKIKGLTIVRYPFYTKIKTKEVPTAFFFSNPLWIIWNAYYIYKFSRKYKIDILHISGKYSIMPVRLANVIFKKKIIATIRDYQVICNYGFCLFNKDSACGNIEYFTKDFIFYLKHYLKDKSLLIIIKNLIFAVNARIYTKLLKFFSKDLKIVVLSKKQLKIFQANGFRDVDFIYNSVSFSEHALLTKKEKIVLYAGRLTYGKGVGILLETISSFFKKFPNYRFLFIGEGPLRPKLIEMAKQFRNLGVLGQVDHKKLLKSMAKSQVIVVPSLWPEPFGRIALESLSQKTPVVATKKGGLPEIVKNLRWGYVVNTSSQALLEGIEKAIINNKELVDNIKKDFGNISKKFGSDVADKYLKIYKILASQYL